LKFFEAVSRWDSENPQKTLDHVVSGALVAIKTGEGLFPLIPNSPFPACSVVQALAYLVELGIVCHVDLSMDFLYLPVIPRR